jgi:uncharacterized Zn finger protein
MLADILNNDALEERAGERAFERGADYFAEGHVVGLKEKNGAITARVRGTYFYRVKLWDEDEELASKCNCPVGQDGVFCKHCVAVGLAWLDTRKQEQAPARGRARRDLTDDDIRAHLKAQDKDSLVKLLMDHAEWDADFRDRLVLATARREGGTPNLAAFRAAIDKTIRCHSFVHYREMPDYARSVEAVVDSLGELLERGNANEVRQLAERALKQMESAMNSVDDSDGFLGGILDHLQELHLSACRVVKPNPRALAKFLLKWEIRSGWEIFLGAADTYAEVLGKIGLSEYRGLAEAKWAKVPQLTPGETDPDRYGGRWRITRVMETLAKQQGDIEALVAVKSRDLSAAFSFLEIAQIYSSAGKAEAALAWAERGARAFPLHTDGRLRDFLIKEYQSRGRHDEAIAIAWTSFREHPGLDTYQRLHRSSLRAKQWPQWREKAIALLREDIRGKKEQAARSSRGLPVRADHSDLVEIYLWERDSEAAWNEAKAGGCHKNLWIRLAEARQNDHPEDAVVVYSEQLESALKWAQQSAYEEAVEILRKIGKLQGRVGKQAQFAALLQSIRVQYKPRRNLMKLMDAQGWTQPSP